MTKNILITLSLVGALAGAYFLLKEEVPDYVAQSAPVLEIKEVQKLDNVSEAQRQLNEAKKLLDDEEKNILAEIKSKEKRIEEIRQVRLSFSQAPKQVE